MDDKPENSISYNLQVSQLVKSENVEDLTCLICLGICFRPIILKCCEHLLCLNCAKQFVLKKSFCPYCKNTNLDFSLPSKLVSRFFDNLVFYCPNKSNGCSEQIRYSSYFEHITNCNKMDLQSIYTKLNYCKKFFRMYYRHKDHSCYDGCSFDKHGSGSTSTSLSELNEEVDNILFQKLVILEKSIGQTNINEEPLKIGGITVPEIWNKTEYYITYKLYILKTKF